MANLVKMTTAGKWEGGMKTAVQIRNFAPVYMDEPQMMGGQDEGPNPMEYLLAALTGCCSVMIGIIAKEMNFTYSDVQFENVGFLDPRGLMGVEGVAAGFQKVRNIVTITTEENQERIETLRDQVEKRCPVFSMMNDAGVNMEVIWKKTQVHEAVHA